LGIRGDRVMKIKITKAQKSELEDAFETYFEERPVKIQGNFIIGSIEDLRALARNIEMDYGTYGLEYTSASLKRSMMSLKKKIETLKENRMDLIDKYLGEGERRFLEENALET
jgi:hypothetical protein